jgi:GxxExxY protein
MLHEKTTESIIGAAMTVLNKLKPGLDEKLYERALAIELVKRGHHIEQQKSHVVTYENVVIGNLVPDLIVDGAVIADPKVVSEFNETHISQMIGYLNITGLSVALLLNFKYSDLRWKRVVRSSVPSVKSVVKQESQPRP